MEYKEVALKWVYKSKTRSVLRKKGNVLFLKYFVSLKLFQKFQD